MTAKNKAFSLVLFSAIFGFSAWFWLHQSDRYGSWQSTTFGVGAPGILFRGAILWILIGITVVSMSKAIIYAVEWLAPKMNFPGIYFYRLAGVSLLIFLSLLVLFGAIFWIGMGYRDGGSPTTAVYLASLVWMTAKITAGFWFILIPIISLISIGTSALRKNENGA